VTTQFRQIYVLVCLLLVSSCGKEIFAPKTQTHRQSGSRNGLKAITQCAGFTSIEPEVDFLFVVDNSTSTYFLTPEVLQAFSNTLRYIATQRFNYRIAIIPLIDNGQKAIISKYPIPGVQLTNINSINIGSYFQTAGGAQEHGFFRVLDYIGKNVDSGNGSGIFRKNANTIVVSMSNQDDNDYLRAGTTIVKDLFQERTEQFMKFTKTYWDFYPTAQMDPGWDRLDANRLRYITIVADTPHVGAHCSTTTPVGVRYQNMSKTLYYWQGDSDQNPSDPHPDSYDLCSGNFSNIFKQINNTIKDIVQAHTYDHWPVAEIASASTPFDIDVSTISVTKVSGGSPIQNLGVYPQDPNGYQYLPGHQTVDTRLLPTPGEPRTGYFVKLFGSGMPTYPECIQVNYRRVPDYYGYIVLPQEPLRDASLNITKNGSRLSESTSNGWQYIGYRQSWNIRVSGIGDSTPLNTATKPGIYKSGHIFKLNGNAIYSNNDVVNVDYKPAPL
jgi:hypothetical protein